MIIKGIVSICQQSVRFYRYLFSYIILTAVLLLIVISVVYGNFIKILQQEVELSSTALLCQVKDSMDLRREEMNRIGVQIQSDPMLTASEVTDGEYGSYQTSRELMKYKSTNGLIYEMALYYGLKEKEKLYTSQGTISLDTFFERLYRFDDWDKNKFIDLFESIRSPVMWPVQPALINGVSESGFAVYLYPLPNNGSKPYGVAMFLIQDNELQDMMQNVLKEHSGYVYILDEKNHPIATLSSRDAKYNAENILDALQTGSISRAVSQVLWNREKFSVVKITGNNQWSYVSAIPVAQFMGKVHRSQRSFNYMIGILLILGILMAVGFSIYNYNPLKKLASAIKTGKNIDSSRYKDEIQFISDSITKISEENIGLMSKLNSKVGIVKEKLLLTLLKGVFMNDDEIQDMIDISHIRLEGPYFAVLLFLIDDYDKFKENHSSSMQNLMKFSIINVIEELSLEIGNGYGVELIHDRGVGLVVNIRESEDQEERILQLAHKTKDFFKEYFEFTLTVGIGSRCDDLRLLHKSYLEASRAAYYRLIRGNDTVIFFKDLKNDEESQYRHPLELESKLIMCIKQGKVDEVRETIKNIICDLKKQSLSPELVQGICFGIINVMMKTVDEMDIKMNPVLYGEMENFFKEQYETIAALEETILDFSGKICMSIDDQKKNKNDELRDRIIEYVKKYCYDDTLSLEGIGNEFGLSPSYITRLFKDQTGYTLKTYIDIHRLNKAKRLLKETDLKLKEIVREIGYFDETSFIRKFKKSEGVTPMHYRNIVKGVHGENGLT